jgi:hypothetical protein
MSKRAAALLRGLWAGSRVAVPISSGSGQSGLHRQLRQFANNAAAAQAHAAEKEAWKPSGCFCMASMLLWLLLALDLNLCLCTAGPVSLVLFVPSIVCGYLSYWQYERSRWKVGYVCS